MRSILLSLATESRQLPQGVQFAGYRFAVGSTELVTLDTFAILENLPDSAFTATCAAIDETGDPIGMTVQVDVPQGGGGGGGQQTYLAPTGLSFTVA